MTDAELRTRIAAVGAEVIRLGGLAGKTRRDRGEPSATLSEALERFEAAVHAEGARRARLARKPHKD